MVWSLVAVVSIAGLMIPVAAEYGACQLTGVGAALQDQSALKFAYFSQNLLYQYYDAHQYNSSFYSSMNMSMSMSADVQAMVQGLHTKARLGVQGIENQYQQVENYLAGPQMSNLTMHAPDQSCQPKFPPVGNVTGLVQTATQMEAYLCAIFIGLGDFVEDETTSFLMARLAAEHGIVASYLMAVSGGSLSNSTDSLTLAVTPDQGLEMLSPYLSGNCSSEGLLPSTPCAGRVAIGNLNATLAVNQTIGTCNGTQYRTSDFICDAGVLCPVYAPMRCGQSCYSPTAFDCQNGTLVSR